MTVQSATELHDLIMTLSGQFAVHHQSTNALWTTANGHINTVQQEAGTWITHEINNLINEWQSHLLALQHAEQWFEQHHGLLPNIAADAARLASEALG